MVTLLHFKALQYITHIQTIVYRIVSCTTVLIRNVSTIKQNVDLYLTNHILFRILSYLVLPFPRFFKTDPPIS